MKHPFAIVFAGAPGSSKSIVSHHLSVEFDLPIINRDIIRSEVKEDLLITDIREPRANQAFEKRFEERWGKILASKRPIILDGSVDRSWEKVKNQLEAAGYQWFMINMELSRSFFTELFSATNRSQAIKQLDGYLEDHRKFMVEYGADVNIKINDAAFPKRLEVAAGSLRQFLS